MGWRGRGRWLLFVTSRPSSGAAHDDCSICWVQEDKLAVIVGTVTDDVRLYEMPKMRVCALRFTETARARIIKVCGENLNFVAII